MELRKLWTSQNHWRPVTLRRELVMFKSTGTLQYFTNPYKVWVLVDPGIAAFYRSMIPPIYGVKRPKYPAHISVVRKAIPRKLDAWGLHEGRQITFEYELWHYNDHRYWWLGVRCNELEDIRLELGLPRLSDITRSPDSGHPFHITIGNTKEQ